MGREFDLQANGGNIGSETNGKWERREDKQGKPRGGRDNINIRETQNSDVQGIV